MIVMGGAGNSVHLKTLKWQTVHGSSFAKRFAIRTLMVGIFVLILPLLQIMRDVDGCDSEIGFSGSNSVLGRVLVLFAPLGFPHLRSGVCMENMSLTVNLAVELMSKNLLDYDSKALCIGHRSSEAVIALNEMGFSDVHSIHRHPFSMVNPRQFVYEFDFHDNVFDFVIMRDLNEISVPVLLVNQVERILKPGGVAAIVVGARGSSHDSLIRSATSVSSYLKSSSVAHVMSLGSFSVVAIRKRVNSFEGYRLPVNCPSFKRNARYMKNIESLLDKKPEGSDSKRIAYLPKFANIPSNGNLVYIDMGVKEAANFNGSNWFLPSYPIESRAFSVYIVDHDALVLTSHVTSPGVTFVYHPALAENTSRERMTNDDEEPLLGEDDFDFLVWFKETVEFADFVVLKMNMGDTEMNFLSKLFETGTICLVDELFLHCPESSCFDVFKSLRKVGVYVHQWYV